MIYGHTQSEDDLAEKARSNEILQRSISTYGEVASLPNVPDDLVKLTLKRRADRQQFLGKDLKSVLTAGQMFKNALGFFKDCCFIKWMIHTAYVCKVT